MPATYSQSILGASDFSPQIVNDISVITQNWFVNRTPLLARLPRVPVGRVDFQTISRTPRPRTATLGAAVANNTVGTVTLIDVSPFMVDDVLELASGERVQITSLDLANNTASVTRGVSGTTAAAQNNATSVLLIGNARTGAAVDQAAIAAVPTAVTQYCQTFQHPVQVGGSLASTTNFQVEEGQRAPFDQFKMEALRNLVDDIEYTTYYGLGDAGTTTGRPQQKGLKSLIASGNVVTDPTNKGAYTAYDFVRDAFTNARANGGEPDVVLLSSNFMTGLAKWGHAVQRLDAGATAFGTPIDVFEAPFLGGVKIIEAPLLRSFTAVALTSEHVRFRTKRNEFWSPRGVRGDAIEGDWIAEMAVEVGNPAFHAWVEGITVFSA